MADPNAPQQNRLLAALSFAERERVCPHLRLVQMPLGKVLCEPGAVLQNVYFPTDSVISQVYVTADGASAQVSSVGNDGALGIALFLSGQSMTGHAIVQFAGSAYCLAKDRFQQELARHGEMQRIMLRYTHALLTETAQTVVCNRYHSVDQQLCRWLLVALDRLPSNRLTITQELLGGILGVRRESVTEAAGKLQKVGAIAYRRGKITVIDRLLLERLCCECYAVVRKETDRLSRCRSPLTNPIMSCVPAEIVFPKWIDARQQSAISAEARSTQRFSRPCVPDGRWRFRRDHAHAGS